MNEMTLELVSEAAARQQAPHEDSELLTLIASGDRSAFDKLYIRYHLRLGRFLRRFTSKRELIDEIVNDTMFTVWCKAASFRGDSRASTWIFGIAYRRALRALRTAARAMPPGTSVPIEAIEVELSAESPAAVCEEREWIETGLAQLPFAQRMVIELAYFLGLSCEEIATVLDCPVNTVKTRMFNARGRLRPLLTRLADVQKVSDGPRALM
jgi:RNA polymerase sigma-70 factor, ECF subfamily